MTFCKRLITKESTHDLEKLGRLVWDALVPIYSSNNQYRHNLTRYGIEQVLDGALGDEQAGHGSMDM